MRGREPRDCDNSLRNEEWNRLPASKRNGPRRPGPVDDVCDRLS